MVAAASAYVARNGARLKQKDAEIIGPELDRLVVKHGAVTPELVVAEAADPSSPLHPYVYRLDDAAAAHEHRLYVARTLIRSIEIVRVDNRGDSQHVRQIEYVPGHGYVPHDAVMADIDLTRTLMLRLRGEIGDLLGRWKRYRHIPAVADIVDELDVIAARFEERAKANAGAQPEAAE